MQPWSGPLLPAACSGLLECGKPASWDKARHPSMDSWLLPHTVGGPETATPSTPAHKRYTLTMQNSKLTERHFSVFSNQSWMLCYFTPKGGSHNKPLGSGQGSPRCSPGCRTGRCAAAYLAGWDSATLHSSEEAKPWNTTLLGTEFTSWINNLKKKKKTTTTRKPIYLQDYPITSVWFLPGQL